MGKPDPVYHSKETRIQKLDEVSLGFNKKIAQDEARRCPQCALATCLPGCPLGIDIPGFIRLLREGDTTLALERIKKENPFAAICGRVCSAPCEELCVFHADGHPISIRALERYASDFGASKPEKTLPGERGKKVAIIGSGPAGMSAAYYLSKGNIGVSIFEAAHEPGGLLRYAIPEFRLPQKIVDEQFNMLKNLGVEVKTDVVFGRTLLIDELFMQGYGAVLLATGATLPLFTDMPGSSLAGVYYDLEFLYRLQSFKKQDAIEQARQQGIAMPQTVVIGQGPSAFDAARLSRRLGSQVELIFEGFEEQSGVGADILKETTEEGIQISSYKALEIVGDGNGFAEGVRCLKLEIVDGKDGLSLEASREEPFILPAQTVIIANGQKPGGFLKQYLPQLKWNENGSLWIDEQTGMTSIDKLFSCGSLATAGGSVVEAIAGGKAAAQKIIEHITKS